MASEDRDREFKIRPTRRRRHVPDEAKAWSHAFGQIMHFARMSSHRRSPGSRVHARRINSNRFTQRCAVRVTYCNNKTAGQWAAHGRYLSRESATNSDENKNPRFDQDLNSDTADIATVLGAWQKAGDPRLFKLIISPEFGDRLDLEGLTRGVMAGMEKEAGSRLQWVAAIHRNTEYPHVHVALRGITEDGHPLRFARDYIRHGIRKTAEDLATAKLGYRTELDAHEAQRREVHQLRYTSLDWILKQAAASMDHPEGTENFVLELSSQRSQPKRQHLLARLLFLRSMGLAEAIEADRWRVRSDFETVLRAMQRTADRQRTLAAQSVLVSDPRLPNRVTDLRGIKQLSGRVLGHREDETSGRPYMILEGTDRQIHFIYHTREIEAARRKGQLPPNSFARFRRLSAPAKGIVAVEDLGSADGLLRNKQHLRRIARGLLRQGVTPAEAGLSGWLGRYEAALAHAASELHAQRTTNLAVSSKRDGGRR
jgi:type IV secretory pathway VirD2 relaxase